MMHITTRRQRHTSTTKPWPIEKTYQAIKPVANRFVVHVLAQYGNKLPHDEKVKWEELSEAFRSTGTKVIVAEEKTQPPGADNPD
jgi:predicted metallopeptidase